MRQQFLRRFSFHIINSQCFVQKVFAFLANIYIAADKLINMKVFLFVLIFHHIGNYILKLSLFGNIKSSFEIFIWNGSGALKHFVCDDAKGPNVDFFSIVPPLVLLVQFRCHIHLRATSLAHAFFSVKVCCKSKVRNFY